MSEDNMPHATEDLCAAIVAAQAAALRRIQRIDLLRRGQSGELTDAELCAATELFGTESAQDFLELAHESDTSVTPVEVISRYQIDLIDRATLIRELSALDYTFGHLEDPDDMWSEWISGTWSYVEAATGPGYPIDRAAFEQIERTVLAKHWANPA